MTEINLQHTDAGHEPSWESVLIQRHLSHRPEIPESERRRLSRDISLMLGRRKTLREARGLNHWQDYAEQRVERLLRLIAYRRREDIGGFLKQTMEHALALAHQASGDLVEAEAVVSEANLRLWRGKMQKAKYLLWIAAEARSRRYYGGLTDSFSGGVGDTQDK